MDRTIRKQKKQCSKLPLGAAKIKCCAQKLAESIIIQSIEDLWDRNRWAESVTFFTGKRFSICAGIAGMDFHAQVRLLEMINRTMAALKSRQFSSKVI